MLIVDHLPDNYLDEVKTFAKSQNLLDQFEDKLEYLSNYSDSITRCLLFKDFAPYSFQFKIERQLCQTWEFWFNGGLIFHPAGNSGVNFPQLSVRLNTSKASWCIHT